MLMTADIFLLINYFSQILWLSVVASIAALLWLRKSKWVFYLFRSDLLTSLCFSHFRPDLPRPIKVNLAIPIIFIVLCVILVMLPSIDEPMNLVYGILITLTGIPFYYLGIKWKNRPAVLGNSSKSVERFCQLLFNTLFVDAQEKENWIFFFTFD